MTPWAIVALRSTGRASRRNTPAPGKRWHRPSWRSTTPNWVTRPGGAARRTTTMPDHPTPGQVHYEALCTAYRATYPGIPLALWSDLTDAVRGCWEAAAQAVLAAAARGAPPQEEQR